MHFDCTAKIQTLSTLKLFWGPIYKISYDNLTISYDQLTTDV